MTRVLSVFCNRRLFCTALVLHIFLNILNSRILTVLICLVYNGRYLAT